MTLYAEDADGCVVPVETPTKAQVAAIKRKKKKIPKAHLSDKGKFDYHDPGTGKFAPLGFVTPKRLRGLLSENAKLRDDVRTELRDKIDGHSGLLTEYARALKAGDKNKAAALAQKLRQLVLGDRPSGAASDDMLDRNGWDAGSRELGKMLGPAVEYAIKNVAPAVPQTDLTPPARPSTPDPLVDAFRLSEWETLKPWNATRDPNSSDPNALLLNGEPAPRWLRIGPGRGTEAASHMDDHIRITPAFLDLPNEDVKRSALYHEAGHGLSDRMLEDQTAFDLVNDLPSFGHLNGQTTPGEVAAEAYSILWSEPSFLDQHAPGIRDAIISKADEYGYPLPDGMGRPVAPEAPAAPGGQPHAKLRLPDPKGDTPTGWTKVGGQGGSNPGGRYRVDDPPSVLADGQVMPTDLAPGDEFYVKRTKSLDHANTELAANLLYERAGVSVPNVHQGDNPELVASKIVTGDTVSLAEGMKDPAVLSKIRSDMVVDAWLSNWDVVGLELDNIIVVDGEPWRIDAGGALSYRAMGGKKGNAFGDEVVELDSLRNPSMNSQAAKVFGGATDDELRDGATRVANISPEDIQTTVDEMGLDQSVADKLIARRADIIAKVLDGQDPLVGPPQENGPEVAPPAQDVLPEAPVAPQVAPEAPPLPAATVDAPADMTETVPTMIRAAAQANGKITARVGDPGRMRKFGAGDVLEVGYKDDEHGFVWVPAANGKSRKFLVKWDRLDAWSPQMADGRQYATPDTIRALVQANDGPTDVRVGDGLLWRLGAKRGDTLSVSHLDDTYGLTTVTKPDGSTKEYRVRWDRFDALPAGAAMPPAAPDVTPEAPPAPAPETPNLPPVPFEVTKAEMGDMVTADEILAADGASPSDKLSGAVKYDGVDLFVVSDTMELGDGATIGVLFSYTDKNGKEATAWADFPNPDYTPAAPEPVPTPEAPEAPPAPDVTPEVGTIAALDAIIAAHPTFPEFGTPEYEAERDAFKAIGAAPLAESGRADLMWRAAHLMSQDPTADDYSVRGWRNKAALAELEADGVDIGSLEELALAVQTDDIAAMTGIDTLGEMGWQLDAVDNELLRQIQFEFNAAADSKAGGDSLDEWRQAAALSQMAAILEGEEDTGTFNMPFGAMPMSFWWQESGYETYFEQMAGHAPDMARVEELNMLNSLWSIGHAVEDNELDPAPDADDWQWLEERLTTLMAAQPDYEFNLLTNLNEAMAERWGDDLDPSDFAVFTPPSTETPDVETIDVQIEAASKVYNLKVWDGDHATQHATATELASLYQQKYAATGDTFDAEESQYWANKAAGHAKHLDSNPTPVPEEKPWPSGMVGADVKDLKPGDKIPGFSGKGYDNEDLEVVSIDPDPDNPERSVLLVRDDTGLVTSLTLHNNVNLSILKGDGGEAASPQTGVNKVAGMKSFADLEKGDKLTVGALLDAGVEVNVLKLDSMSDDEYRSQVVTVNGKGAKYADGTRVVGIDQPDGHFTNFVWNKNEHADVQVGLVDSASPPGASPSKAVPTAQVKAGDKVDVAQFLTGDWAGMLSTSHEAKVKAAPGTATVYNAVDWGDGDVQLTLTLSSGENIYVNATGNTPTVDVLAAPGEPGTVPAQTGVPLSDGWEKVIDSLTDSKVMAAGGPSSPYSLKMAMDTYGKNPSEGNRYAAEQGLEQATKAVGSALGKAMAAGDQKAQDQHLVALTWLSDRLELVKSGQSVMPSPTSPNEMKHYVDLKAGEKFTWGDVPEDWALGGAAAFADWNDSDVLTVDYLDDGWLHLTSGDKKVKIAPGTSKQLDLPVLNDAPPVKKKATELAVGDEVTLEHLQLLHGGTTGFASSKILSADPNLVGTISYVGATDGDLPVSIKVKWEGWEGVSGEGSMMNLSGDATVHMGPPPPSGFGNASQYVDTSAVTHQIATKEAQFDALSIDGPNQTDRKMLGTARKKRALALELASQYGLVGDAENEQKWLDEKAKWTEIATGLEQALGLPPGGKLPPPGRDIPEPPDPNDAWGDPPTYSTGITTGVVDAWGEDVREATRKGKQVTVRLADNRLSKRGLKKGDIVTVEFVNDKAARVMPEGDRPGFRASWERFDGIVENPDGVTEVVDDIGFVSAMNAVAADPHTGSVFAFDEDAVEGYSMRVRAVRYRDTEVGGDGDVHQAHQFKFKIRDNQYEAMAAAMEGGENIEGVSLAKEQDGIVTPDERGNEWNLANRKVKRFTLADGREAVVEWHRVKAGVTDPSYNTSGGAPWAVNNMVQVHVLEDGKPVTQADFADLMEQLGIPVGYPSEEQQRAYKTKMLDSLFYKPGESSMPGHQAAAELYGITPDDIVLERVGGLITPMLSESKAAELAQRTGVGGFHHQFSSGNHGDSIMLGGNGLASTVTRWSEGVGVGGMSSSADVRTGGADYVFTRQSDNRRVNAGSYGVMVNPVQAFRRLDWFSYKSDTYGSTRPNERRTRNNLSNVGYTSSSSSRETMFKGSIPVEHWDYMTVPTDVRERTLEQARDRGITTVNGIPLEDFVRTTDMPIPKMQGDGSGFGYSTVDPSKKVKSTGPVSFAPEPTESQLKKLKPGDQVYGDSLVGMWTDIGDSLLEGEKFEVTGHGVNPDGSVSLAIKRIMPDGKPGGTSLTITSQPDMADKAVMLVPDEMAGPQAGPALPMATTEAGLIKKGDVIDSDSLIAAIQSAGGDADSQLMPGQAYKVQKMYVEDDQSLTFVFEHPETGNPLYIGSPPDFSGAVIALSNDTPAPPALTGVAQLSPGVLQTGDQLDLNALQAALGAAKSGDGSMSSYKLEPGAVVFKPGETGKIVSINKGDGGVWTVGISHPNSYGSQVTSNVYVMDGAKLPAVTATQPAQPAPKSVKAIDLTEGDQMKLSDIIAMSDGSDGKFAAGSALYEQHKLSQDLGIDPLVKVSSVTPYADGTLGAVVTIPGTLSAEVFANQDFELPVVPVGV